MLREIWNYGDYVDQRIEVEVFIPTYVCQYVFNVWAPSTGSMWLLKKMIRKKRQSASMAGWEEQIDLLKKRVENQEREIRGLNKENA